MHLCLLCRKRGMSTVYKVYKLNFDEWKKHLNYTDNTQAKADWQEWFGEDAKYIYEAVMQDDRISAIYGVGTFAGTYNACGLAQDKENITREQMLNAIFSGF